MATVPNVEINRHDDIVAYSAPVEWGDVLGIIQAENRKAVKERGEDPITVSRCELAFQDCGSEWLTKRGKFPKRFASACHDRGIELSPAIRSQLGTVKAHTYLRFTRDLDWSDGDFGDSGSCFFSSGGKYVWHREALDKYRHSFAIQSFDKGDVNEGTGRCLGVQDGDAIVLFNAYGLELDVFARLIAGQNDALQVTEAKSSSSLDSFYVNDDRELLVVHPPTYKPKKKYDIAEIVGCRPKTPCAGCGCALDLEDDGWQSVSDEIYCDDCYFDRFSYCPICEESYPHDDMVETSGELAEEHSHVCEYCAKDGTYRHGIGEKRRGDDIHRCIKCEKANCDGLWDQDGEWICEECASEHVQCAECTCYVCAGPHRHRLENEQWVTYCVDCAPDDCFEAVGGSADSGLWHHSPHYAPHHSQLTFSFGDDDAN